MRYARAGRGNRVSIQRFQRFRKDLPAVHDNRLTSDKARFLRGEEQRGVTNVLGGAEPLQRNRGGHGLVVFRPERLQPLGDDLGEVGHVGYAGARITAEFLRRSFRLGAVPRDDRDLRPFLAKTRAMPLPMPLLAPVTTTDYPQSMSACASPSNVLAQQCSNANACMPTRACA